MVDSSSHEGHGLYASPSVQRYAREVAKVKAAKAAPYTISDFSSFDSLSYCGHTSIESFIAEISLGPDSLALDLCSGIGATSRLVASKSINVVAVELNENLSAVHNEINSLCEVKNIQCVHGNACTVDLAGLGIEGKCDLVYSLQSFLHIADKDTLFALCNRALKEGGHLYIEDHIRSSNPEELTQEEAEICTSFEFNSPINQEEYTRVLQNAGFDVFYFDERPKDFSQHVFARAEQWAINKDQIVMEHGSEYWDTRIRSGIYNSCKLYHDIGVSLDEAKAKYPNLLQLIGEEEFTRWVTMPSKFTGAYIKARKIRSN